MLVPNGTYYRRRDCEHHNRELRNTEGNEVVPNDEKAHAHEVSKNLGGRHDAEWNGQEEHVRGSGRHGDKKVGDVLIAMHVGPDADGVSHQEFRWKTPVGIDPMECQRRVITSRVRGIIRRSTRWDGYCSYSSASFQSSSESL